ncbi:hypothetical protein ADUPG1_004085, partial [Aduncisulcus paluster]
SMLLQEVLLDKAYNGEGSEILLLFRDSSVRLGMLATRWNNREIEVLLALKEVRDDGDGKRPDSVISYSVLSFKESVVRFVNDVKSAFEVTLHPSA